VAEETAAFRKVVDKVAAPTDDQAGDDEAYHRNVRYKAEHIHLVQNARAEAHRGKGVAPEQIHRAWLLTSSDFRRKALRLVVALFQHW
jgi:hypothetical protein